MALEVTVGFPGVDIIDQTQLTSIVSPYGVGLILGSANQGTIQQLYKVNSYVDFQTHFGTDSPSDKYIKSFFDNRRNQNIALYFYRVNPDTVTPGTPEDPIATDYVDALTTDIDVGFNPGGIVIAPEAFETYDQAERKTISDAMASFCNYDTRKSYWVGLPDLPVTVTDINTAVAEKTATLTATKGQLFTYTPHYRNLDSTPKTLLPSAAMMAIILSLWASGQYYQVPAGSDYTILDFKEPGYAIKQTQWSVAHQGNINLIRLFTNIGYAPDDAITLSPSKEYYHINSVVCFRIVIYMLQLELQPYVHKALSGDTELLSQAVAACIRVLQTALDSGYLVKRQGRPTTDAYTVDLDVQNLPDPGNSVAVIQVAVRPAYALQKIVVYIRNTLGSASDTLFAA